ncbi:preprotein translocase subunit SecG [Pelagibius sp. Alg239-R121]|uniref:preprotein translocase subunit SecG n=1 Tax=Pelagibius sp. Alg239-R121 TaxID=2993448 RepID=UPI0024A6CCB8|nr:preprotein translocase subunit SecG [Pelagibius sp. Alg239-R121]
MNNVVLVIHLLLALAMIGVVLLQKSEGGGLGIGGGGGSGGSGGMGGFLTGRGTANLLTRATAVLAGLFMLSSLGLTILGNQSIDRGSIVDDLQSPAAPIELPLDPAAPPVPQN